MNPRIDLSKSSRFTVWEGGFFNPKTRHGSAFIIGGPNGEALDTLYVTNPQRFQYNCCFPAEAGQIIAYAHLIQKGTTQVTLELARIKACITDLIQGQAVPTADLETLFVYTGKGDPADGVARYLTQDHSRQEYARLIELAIEKARTEQAEQRHFWGKQRVRNDQ